MPCSAGRPKSCAPASAGRCRCACAGHTAPVNPGGFDLELWLFEQGIGASGYVRSRPGAGARSAGRGAGQPLQRAAAGHPRCDRPPRGRPSRGRRAGRADGGRPGRPSSGQTGMSFATPAWRIWWPSRACTSPCSPGSRRRPSAACGACARAACCGCPRRWLRAGAACWPALAYALLAGWGVPAQRTVWHAGPGGAVAQRRFALAVAGRAAGRGRGLVPWQTPGLCCSRVSGCPSCAVALLVASEPVFRACHAAHGGLAALAAEGDAGAACVPNGWPPSAWRRCR
jgi:hypothetical protein